MNIKADKWHRLQVDFRSPVDLDIDDGEFYTLLVKFLGGEPTDGSLYIDDCKIWGIK